MYFYKPLFYHNLVEIYEIMICTYSFTQSNYKYVQGLPKSMKVVSTVLPELFIGCWIFGKMDFQFL